MVDAAKVDRKFENACSYALHEFGLYHFKEQQRLAMKELILGRDVFVILPTGSGKSLIFQAFALVLDYIEGNHGRHLSIVVVISPLLSLTKDQVNYLQSKGVKAAYLGEGQEDETVKDGVEKGEYQIVYGSPETFLATIRWRKMLSSTVYRQNLRLIAVDEAHCISHWGFSLKKGERAFRIWFRRINELRSLVGRVPLLALTATATKETRNKITKTLEMDNAVLFSAIPDRKNIAYAVQVTGSDPQTTFQTLINTLKEKRQTCDRVIIYCPRIKTVAALYGIFKGELGEDMYVNRDCNPQERLVEMYHARIDEQNKDTILKSFSDENGCIHYKKVGEQDGVQTLVAGLLFCILMSCCSNVMKVWSIISATKTQFVDVNCSLLTLMLICPRWSTTAILISAVMFASRNVIVMGIPVVLCSLTMCFHRTAVNQQLNGV